MGRDDQLPALKGEASASQTGERPLWNLDRDEQRVLIITFAGGLASIVAGACILGGAIAIARYVHRLTSPGLAAYTAVFYTVATVLLDYWRRRRRTRWGKTICVVLMVITSFAAALFFLGLLGSVAGIH